jgi:hypothetical protein
MMKGKRHKTAWLIGAALFVGSVSLSSAQANVIEAYPNCGYEILGPNGCEVPAAVQEATNTANQVTTSTTTEIKKTVTQVENNLNQKVNEANQIAYNSQTDTLSQQTQPSYDYSTADNCAPIEIKPTGNATVEVKPGPTPPSMDTILKKEERTIEGWGREFKNKDAFTLLQIIRDFIKNSPPPPKTQILNAPDNCCYATLVKPPVYKEIEIEYVKHDPKYQINVTPPQFNKTYIKQEVLVRPAYTEKVCTEPKYAPVTENVTIPVIEEENGVICKKLKPIPVTRMKLVEPPKCKIIKHPAKYAIVKIPVEKLVKDATCSCTPGKPEIAKLEKTIKVQDPQLIWDAILCEDNLGPEQIKLIQQKLQQLRYYNGPINGRLDDNTLAAVVKFQIDHDLPAGYISIETLEKLGLYELAKNYTACELRK